jgi:putative membrane-bound dehydrogenase-like protein
MKYLPLLTALALLLASARGQTPALPTGILDTQNPKDKPLSPPEALRKITLPEGFHITLFAGEPDVLQPIAFDFDDRGRLWVVECFSFPDFKSQDSDRIVIYTDRDGDGRFDERKVFYDKGHRLSGLAVGFGGVWVCSAPELLFIPDANGDDVPDTKPVAHLNGFTLKAGHNMVNGLAWGPDGWLYGRHGITAPSLVGRPGTSAAERLSLSCSIWRYHPVRHVFEVVTHGTTNPWGLDWDENGQPFFSNNVIGHLFHVVPGAHYQRMFGEDFNPYVYGLMEACSDHKHFGGADWTKSRGGLGEHDALGGGHSHAGAMVYLGDNWPDPYRGTLFMGNIHGNRVLYDVLQRQGSGYVAHHGTNFLMANDPWFRPISIHYGPDGGVFVSDWNDLGECHDNDGVYRSSGRIYKITYGAPKPVTDVNLARLSDLELVKLQLHKNDWFVRHARRLLQERAAAGQLDKSTAAALLQMFTDNHDVTRQLRAFWALHCIGRLPENFLLKQLDHPNEHVRWWAAQLLGEPYTPASAQASPALLAKFEQMAREETSALARLALASTLQRLPLKDRWPIVEKLMAHGEDSTDPNLPLMIWYAAEPLIPSDRARAVQLMRQCKIQLVREFIARRLAAN